MRSLAWRLVVLPAVVAALLVPGARATATASPRPAPAPRPKTSELTLQMRDLFVSRDRFGLLDRMRASMLLARPTDGPQDPEGEGYSSGSTKLCNYRICVHYVRSGSDAPPSPWWVRHTLRTMRAMWHHEVDELGFHRPPHDAHRGGDGRFDVYLTDLGSRGLFGYCTPEKQVLGKKYAASGYCVLDNDFAKSQYGARPNVSLQVTAAHEFFHAIQFGYDYRADPWLMESTAVWMEESYADRANDNRRYLPYGAVHRPGVPLDEYSDTGYGQYGNWAFWQFLTDKYGDGLVRKVWNRVDATPGGPAQASVPALQHVLNTVTHSTHGLADELTAFHVANLDPSKAYPEGRSWPTPKLRLGATMVRPDGVRARTLTVNHLAAQDLAVHPPAAGARRNLRVVVTGPQANSHVVVTVVHADGGLTHRSVAMRHGRARAVVGFSPGKVSTVVVTVVNTSARYACGRGTLLSCAGMPKDDGRRYDVTARVRPAPPRHRSHRSHRSHRPRG